jgi:hypothetical protein
MEENYFGNLKTWLFEIEVAEKTGNIERVENLKNAVLKELKVAIEVIDAFTEMHYRHSIIGNIEEKILETFYGLCATIWNWQSDVDDYAEFGEHVGIPLDELSEISIDEKTGFEALWQALKPFLEAYDKKRQEFLSDAELPF